MTTALRPLSTGELLDRTFALYRSHFGLFIGIFALPNLVVVAFQCIGLTFQSRNTNFANAMMTFAWTMLVLFLTLIITSVSQAATVVAVSNVHLGRSATVADSFSTIKGQIFGVLVLSIITNLSAGFGLLFLLVPGVLLWIIWSVAVPVKVLEHRRVFESMSRSIELTKGSWGRIFVIGLLILVLKVAVALLLQWSVVIAATATAKAGAPQLATGWQVLLIVTGFISTSLVGGLLTIALSLVYYDQRVRKEAFDLQLMMSTIDAATIPGTPAQVGA